MTPKRRLWRPYWLRRVTANQKVYTLDLWMALGYDSQDFPAEDHINVWAELLSEARRASERPVR